MLNKIKNGWYIILYHDINWEDSIFTQYIGGTCAPNIFFEQIELMQSLGQFVNIEDGAKLLSRKQIDKPYFSIWFDDGLKGVYNHAYPILNHFNIKPAISVCSDFLNRKKMFWRYQLSFLISNNLNSQIMKILNKFGYKISSSIKKFTTNNFSLEMAKEIDELYNSCTTKEFRQDSFRLFMSIEDLSFLQDNEWTITNHSSSHYKLSDQYNQKLFFDSFYECEKELSALNISKYWVMPFGYPKSIDFFNLRDLNDLNNITFVFVNNRINTKNNQSNSLNRVDAPTTSALDLKKKLLNL